MKKDIKTQDFINLFAEKYGISKVEAKDIINCVMTTLQETIRDNNSVYIWGFGKFSKYLRKAHRFLHPQTKEECYSDANVAVKLHASFDVGGIYEDADDVQEDVVDTSEE